MNTHMWKRGQVDFKFRISKIFLLNLSVKSSLVSYFVSVSSPVSSPVFSYSESPNVYMSKDEVMKLETNADNRG